MTEKTKLEDQFCDELYFLSSKYQDDLCIHIQSQYFLSIGVQMVMEAAPSTEKAIMLILDTIIATMKAMEEE